jgi:drug/metabolite transporter (DMT)-like permease
MRNTIFKGSLLIVLGASCYGMLGVYVKMAYQNGYSTAEVTLSQFILGFAALFILNLFQRFRSQKKQSTFPFKSKIKLVISGTSLGLTSIFYYMAVKYVPVSVGIVLLMQTVWMGIVLEMILYRKFCGWQKVISAIIVIIGSVLATNLTGQVIVMNSIGVVWGLLAAVCYTATMYSTKNIESSLPSHKRSLYMILGGLIIVMIVFGSSLNLAFSYKIFFSWGLLVSLFGTVFPPLLFTAGMPLTGVGLGAILASVEIPVAVVAANLLLKEPVNKLQWFGVILILISVGIMNLQKDLKKTS